MAFSDPPGGSSRGSRSLSLGDVGLSKQRIATPFVHQESVVENLEKKHRENLKNRLKLLFTLPSRTPKARSRSSEMGFTMPVIARAPPASSASLPRSSAPSHRYTSVLTASNDQPLRQGQRGGLVRRHSVGSLVYQSLDERSFDGSNGNGFGFGLRSLNLSRKNGELEPPKTDFLNAKDGFMSQRMPSTSFQTDRDDSRKSTPRSPFKYASYEAESMPATSKAVFQVARDESGTNSTRNATEAIKSDLTNGTSGSKNSKFDFEKWSKISNKATTDDNKYDRKPVVLSTFVISTKTRQETREDDKGTKVNGMPREIGGKTYGDFNKENHNYRQNSRDFDDLDDVFSPTKNCSLDSKSEAHFEDKTGNGSTKNRVVEVDGNSGDVHRQPRNEDRETRLDSGGRNWTTSDAVQTSKPRESSRTASVEAHDLINFDLPDGVTGKCHTANPSSHGHTSLPSADGVKVSSDGVLPHIEPIRCHDDEKSDHSAGESKTEAQSRDARNSKHEIKEHEIAEEMKDNEEHEPTKQKRRELDIDHDEVPRISEVSDVINYLDSSSQVSSVANNSSGNSKRFDGAGASPPDPLEVESISEQVSDGSREIDRTPGKTFEIDFLKGKDFGLGFCVEGGRGHPDGDRPITVKRVFKEHPCASKHLRVGDELYMVANEDLRSMSHIHAWKFLRSLPDGNVKMTIIRHDDD